MLRATILFAVGLCANVLIGLPATAQAPAEVTLTRIDCGTGATPTDVGQRFSDTFYEPPTAVHSTSRNPSTDQRVKLLVFMVADQKNPTTVPE